MNEDDTFKKLRQAPYLEVYKKYTDWLSTQPMPTWSNPWSDDNANRFLKQYGWTYSQLCDKVQKSTVYE